MQAVVLDGMGGITLRELLVPVPGPNEVLIRARATGICGTDLHLISGHYEHGRYPVIPGHEFAGDVVRVGAEVKGFSEGDFVGVDPNISCGQCRWCRTGAKNLCETLLPIGVAVPGSCAELVAVPARVTHRLPDALDEVTGPLVEPLSCVLHAFERVPDWGDQTMVVFGAGSIGLLAVAVACQFGAGQVHVVEPHALRRDVALTLGASSAVADVAQLDPALLDSGKVDLALDASGHPDAIQAAVDILGRRGRLIQMGVARAEALINVSPYQVFARELSIIGSNSLATSYPAAADLIVDLAPILAPLVTHRLPLRNYAAAATQAASPDAIKVQVVPDRE